MCEYEYIWLHSIGWIFMVSYYIDINWNPIDFNDCAISMLNLETISDW